MTQVTLDAASIAQLEALVVPTKVCDATGKVMGTYIPSTSAPDEKADRLRPPLADDEYQRRLQEPARSLPDIWNSLGRT